MNASKIICSSARSFLWAILCIAAAVSTAKADQNPPGCGTASVGGSVSVFFADGTTLVGGNTVSPCETVVVSGAVNAGVEGTCCIEGGTIIITDPDGIEHNVTPDGGVPLLCAGASVSSKSFTFQFDNASPGTKTFTLHYSGISHEQENDVDGSAQTIIPKSVTVAACDDGDPCTDDICDPELVWGDFNERLGGCVFTDKVCEPDADLCTEETCNPDTGVCESGPTKTCEQDADLCTVESCDPVDGVCKSGPTKTCEPDADLCTEETCDPVDGVCKSGPTKTCEPDADLCTVESCNPATGNCESGPTKPCNDDNPCTDDRCDPATGECVFEDNGTCGQNGCTPGFWKNCTAQWCATYSPSQKVNTVFTIPACIGTSPVDHGNRTLLQALGGGGGSGLNGAAGILLRAATAAVLNACKGIGYPLTTQQIIDQTNDALDNCNRGDILDLATTLDGFNNLGCRDADGNSLPCLRAGSNGNPGGSINAVPQ